MAAAAEVARRSFELPPAADAMVIVAEAVTALTMIAPKTIRAVGEVVQVLGTTGHDVAYALRHGSRRPRELK